MNVDTLANLISLLNDGGNSSESSETKELGRHIVVLQRGWVMVGLLSKKGSEYTLKDCSVVRRWGTTNGLGELAESGKLSDTVLDKCPETFFHELTTILIMKCNEKAWE